MRGSGRGRRTDGAANNLQLVSLRHRPVVAEGPDHPGWVRTGVLGEEHCPDLARRARDQHDLPRAGEGVGDGAGAHGLVCGRGEGRGAAGEGGGQRSQPAESNAGVHRQRRVG